MDHVKRPVYNNRRWWTFALFALLFRKGVGWNGGGRNLNDFCAFVLKKERKFGFQALVEAL